MDINQKLLERKKAKSKGRLNKILKTKKKYTSAQKYINQELTEKLQNDPLAEKKQDFYHQLFSGEIKEEPEYFPAGKQKYRPLVENQNYYSQSYQKPQQGRASNDQTSYQAKSRDISTTKGGDISITKSRANSTTKVREVSTNKVNEILTNDSQPRNRKVYDEEIEVEQQVEGKSNRQKKKERGLMKKIYTEKTKRGQPVMKNYINLVVHQLDQQKKNKQMN